MLRATLIRRVVISAWIAAIMTAVVVLPSARAQEKHPFAGSWKANLEKSQQHENHQFKSTVLRFEISDDAVSIIYTGINMAGKEESGTRKVRPDGQERAIAEAPGMVEMAKWVNSHTLEVVAKKAGEVVGKSTYEVSRDEKTLTSKIKGIDGKGRPFEQVIVFDRE